MKIQQPKHRLVIVHCTNKPPVFLIFALPAEVRVLCDPPEGEAPRRLAGLGRPIPPALRQPPLQGNILVDESAHYWSP